MKIYYYKANKGNLGDDLNAWIWDRLIPSRILDREDGLVMLGIGTIIGHPLPSDAKKIIFTSGIGYSSSLPNIAGADWDVLAVRGPLTAAMLGLSEDKAVTDGAILISQFDEFKTPENHRQGVVFMPHESVADVVDWQSICNLAGIEYLDPRGEHFTTIKRLGSAKLVLADAMHAAIIADALRVPWIPMVSSSEISTFKWMDWTLSVRVPYEPVKLNILSIGTLLLGLRNRLTGQVYEYSNRLGDITQEVVVKQQKIFRRKAKLPARYNQIVLGLFRRIDHNFKYASTYRKIYNKKSVLTLFGQSKKRVGYLSSQSLQSQHVGTLMDLLDKLVPCNHYNFG